MKHTNFFLFHFLFYVFFTHAKVSCQSHTTFVPRSITSNPVFELALNKYDIIATKQEKLDNQFFFYATPFNQKSVNGKSLAHLFFPCCQDSITIAENGNGTVNSLWLNLISAPGSVFNASLSMRPTRITSGSFFYTYFTGKGILKNLWLSISTSVVHAKHALNLKESPSAAPGTLPNFTSVIEALSNPIYTAGRFSACPLTFTWVDDVQFKVGYDWWFNDCNYLGLYLTATAPTGPVPTSTFIFDPMVGSNHGRGGFGIQTFNQVWQSCDNNHLLSVIFDFKYQYIFGANERRSFDLINGDWSRYLLVTTASQPFLSFPAINFLTPIVHILPGSTINLWAALHYNHCKWDVEIGYSYWWRQKERLRDCFVNPTKACVNNSCHSIGIFDITGQCSRTPTTTSRATIASGFGTPSDPSFISLNDCSINPCSALNPSTSSHTIYGSFDYVLTGCITDGLIGMGISYEKATNRSALSQWALWGKVGVHF